MRRDLDAIQRFTVFSRPCCHLLLIENDNGHCCRQYMNLGKKLKRLTTIISSICKSSLQISRSHGLLNLQNPTPFLLLQKLTSPF